MLSGREWSLFGHRLAASTTSSGGSFEPWEQTMRAPVYASCSWRSPCVCGSGRPTRYASYWVGPADPRNNTW